MSSLVLSGDTSGTVTLSVPAVSGSNTLTIQAGTGTNSMNTLTTAVASTSGTNIDFTGIPAWVKKITVMFAGVSTGGTSNFLIQLGTSSGIENTGYLSGVGTRTAEFTSTAGFIVGVNSSAALTFTGTITICLYNTNAWVSAGVICRNDGFSNTSSGTKTTSGTLDRVRITTVLPDTFDAGTVNILYEG